MDVAAILGERLYHAAGSECHRRLEGGSAQVLVIPAAMAHEVGMEPCGVCMSAAEEPRTTRKTE